MPYDSVIVLGAGLQGCCVALALRRRGHRLTLIDKASSYMTRPVRCAVPPESVRADLGTRSLGAFLEEFFKKRFERPFSKVSVSVVLAERFRESPGTVPQTVRDLVRRLVEALG
jgi:glycine/D-amino acid oxidase-like deaminating enzyme